LHDAVQHALHSRPRWIHTGVLVAAFAAVTPPASGAAFPPVFWLGSLYPAVGGDGTRGLVLTGTEDFEASGYAVSAAGDVNGDGIDDLIIGAPGVLFSFDGPGNAYVVFGSTAGFPAVMPLAGLYPAGGGDGTRGFVLTGIDADDHSGGSVSAAGDVNGDGIGDVIVGARLADPRGVQSAGESYVVFGSSTGFPAVVPLASLYPAGGGNGTRGFVLTGIDAYDTSGRSVSGAGDINGDGVDDLIVGAPLADPGGRLLAGESYVVFGSSAGFPPVLPLASLYPGGGGDGTQGFVLTGIDADDFLFGDEAGWAVSAAGDVNGDGLDDLIVAAHGADPGGDTYAGESYVVFGSSAGFPAVVPLATLKPAGGGDGTRGFVIAGIDHNDQGGVSGRMVSAAGDINGDGIDDVIIGAHGADPGGEDYAGESYVVFGSSTGFPAVVPLASLFPGGGGDGTRGFVLTGIDDQDESGFSVSAAGDVNRDGVDDLLVGAPGALKGLDPGPGHAYVVFGSTAGVPAVVPLASLFPAGGGDGTRGFVLTGIERGDSTGYAVSAAGDVNGDGRDDLIVGAPLAVPAGKSYVIFGRGAPR
jgi:hypothetical protein